MPPHGYGPKACYCFFIYVTFIAITNENTTYKNLETCVIFPNDYWWSYYVIFDWILWVLYCHKMNEVFPSDMAFYYEEVATSRVVQIILRGMGNLAPLCYKFIAMGNKGHHYNYERNFIFLFWYLSKNRIGGMDDVISIVWCHTIDILSKIGRSLIFKMEIFLHSEGLVIKLTKWICPWPQPTIQKICSGIPAGMRNIWWSILSSELSYLLFTFFYLQWAVCYFWQVFVK